MNFTLVTALFYIFSWISVSVSEFHTVQVQHGEEAILMCTNFTSIISHIHWFRLGSEPNISHISSMTSSNANPTFNDGFQNSRFTMTSNTSTIFLKITQVDLSDSGLYFCGFYKEEKSVIVHATYLNVTQEKMSGLPNVTSGRSCLSVLSVDPVLGGLIIILIIIIVGLAFTIIRFHRALGQRQNSQHSETLCADDLNYASLNFKLKPNRRPASDRQCEENVVYSSTT